MKRIAVIVLWMFARAVVAFAASATTQSVSPPTFVMKLWDGEPPNFVRDAKPERDDGVRIWNVSVPEMLVFLPSAKEGEPLRTAMLVCPGGAYTHLARLQTGDGAVNTFVPKGVAIIVLKYRLSPPAKEADVEADALADGKRAMRLVRLHAKEWGIDPHKVGLLGWSAGSNLGLNLVSHFDAGDTSAADPVEWESCRPDFVALMCPWPHKRDIAAYPIAKDAPPAFICSAKDDTTAPVTFAEAIVAAYQHVGATVEFWRIEKGGHQAFLIDNPGEGGKWVDHFWPWLTKQGFAPVDRAVIAGRIAIPAGREIIRGE